jgi:hypothetical protein
VTAGRALSRIAACLSTLVVAGTGEAQALRLHVVDATGDRPLAGALVTVANPSGAIVATATIPASGSRLLAVPGSGAYRVHVRRIGFEPFVSAPIAVSAADTVSFRIAVRSRPVMLPLVVAEGAPGCQRADDAAGAETVALWEQLRTALALTELARTESDPPSTSVVRFVTRRTADGDSAIRHTVQPAKRSATRPFATYAPSSFSVHGYVRETALGPEFAAPDERVLLSEELVREHCFRYLTGTGEEAGLVGLGFTPVRGRSVADIAGVLWAEPTSGALRHLTFHYVADDVLPHEARGAGRAGGEVVFDTLEDGRWFVRAWHVRMPVARGPDRRVRTDAGLPSLVERRPVLAGYVETGAVARSADAVVPVEDSTASSLPGSAWHRRVAAYERRIAPASLRLVVLDSLVGRPLVGARIWLRQRIDSAALLFEAPGRSPVGARPDRTVHAAADTIVTSGADGSVAVAGLPAGEYEPRWTHDELHQSQIVPTPRVLTLAPGESRVDSATTASFRTYWRACGPVPAGRVGPETGGVVRGAVRASATQAPVAGATVTVQWAPIAGIRTTSAAARTTARGDYSVCGVPVGVELVVAVTQEGRRGPPVPLIIGLRRVAERDLWIGAPTAPQDR